MTASRPQVCLPLPEPYTGPDPCPACHGVGFTGVRYTFDSEEPQATTPVLLVDVFCPTCAGCGQAEHVSCLIDQHADSYRDVLNWDNADDEDDDGSVCPSCQGRRWWCCQGFGGDPVGEVLHELRVACGCATELLVSAG